MENLPEPQAREGVGVCWKGVLETKQLPAGDQIILGSDSNCKVNKGCICKVRFKLGVETWEASVVGLNLRLETLDGLVLSSR